MIPDMMNLFRGVAAQQGNPAGYTVPYIMTICCITLAYSVKSVDIMLQQVTSEFNRVCYGVSFNFLVNHIMFNYFELQYIVLYCIELC